MEKAKLEALKSLIVIFSFPRSNSIFTLAKLNIHSSEKVITTNGLVSFAQRDRSVRLLSTAPSPLSSIHKVATNWQL